MAESESESDLPLDAKLDARKNKKRAKADKSSKGSTGSGESVVEIRKYANRRLYNTRESRYVTLDNIRSMVTNQEPFVVRDARDGRDITHSILTQILMESENQGEPVLPADFLKALINVYEDQVQRLLFPKYLQDIMAQFAGSQATMRQQMSESMKFPTVDFQNPDFKNPFVEGAKQGMESMTAIANAAGAMLHNPLEAQPSGKQAAQQQDQQDQQASKTDGNTLNRLEQDLLRISREIANLREQGDAGGESGDAGGDSKNDPKKSD